MRLAKFLAHAGVASRRRAEELIAAGRVTVGGEVVTDPARDVDERSDVAVDGDAGDGRGGARGLRAQQARGRRLHGARPGRQPHGRLPGATTRGACIPSAAWTPTRSGLILLTNDGELANRLTHPRYEVPKTYRVRLAGRRWRDPALRRLRDGSGAGGRPDRPGAGAPRWRPTRSS